MAAPKIYKYFPNNPHVVVYNFDTPLIEIDSYLVKDDAFPPQTHEWVRALYALPPITEIRVSLYKVMLKRNNTQEFVAFVDQIEDILNQALQPEWVTTVADSDVRRSIPLPAGVTLPRKNFKSPGASKGDTLATDLYAIPGTMEILFREQEIIIIKGWLFPWPPIVEAVEKLLAALKNS